MEYVFMHTKTTERKGTSTNKRCQHKIVKIFPPPTLPPPLVRKMFAHFHVRTLVRADTPQFSQSIKVFASRNWMSAFEEALWSEKYPQW